MKKYIAMLMCCLFAMTAFAQFSSESVSGLGTNVERYNGNAKSVAVPAGTVCIGEECFAGNMTVETITLPASVGWIEERAFAYCPNLKNIIIPATANLMLVAGDAFEGSENLPVKDGFRYSGTDCRILIGVDDESTRTVNIPEGCLWIKRGVFGTTYENDGGDWPGNFKGSITIPKTVKGFDGDPGEIKNLTTYAAADNIDPFLYESDAKTVVMGVNPNYTGDLAQLTIPEGVRIIKAIHLGDFDDSTITSIVIPNTVTAISNGAFRHLTALTSIEIPDSVKIIGERAFDGCTNLKSVKWPAKCTTIRAETFRNCTSLTEIELPTTADLVALKKELPAIENRAFVNTGFKYFVVPEGFLEIGEILKECQNLEEVVLPKGLWDLKGRVVDRCPNFKVMTFLGAPPEEVGFRYESGGQKFPGFAYGHDYDSSNNTWRVQYFPAYAASWKNCEYVYTDVNNPDPTKPFASTPTSYTEDELEQMGIYIDNSALTYYGQGFYYQVAGANATIIRADVEEGQTKVVIPEKIHGYTVTKLATCAVVTWTVQDYGSADIQVTHLPATVTAIEPDAIDAPNAKVFVAEANKTFCSDGNGALFNKAKTTLYRAPGGVDDYPIPATVTTLADGAFYRLEQIQSVFISAKVTNVADGMAFAFSDMNIWVDSANTAFSTMSGHLTNKAGTRLLRANPMPDVVIPDTVTQVSDAAFCGLTMDNLYLPSSITTLPTGDKVDGFLCMVSALKCIRLPRNITSIPAYFAYGTDFEEVVIPAKVTQIGEMAFPRFMGMGSQSMKMIFLGKPPALSYGSVGSESYPNGTIEVRYLAKYAADWEKVKDTEAWNGVTFGTPLSEEESLEKMEVVVSAVDMNHPDAEAVPGRVTASPAIPADGRVAVGTKVTFTATANADYVFAGWHTPSSMSSSSYQNPTMTGYIENPWSDPYDSGTYDVTAMFIAKADDTVYLYYNDMAPVFTDEGVDAGKEVSEHLSISATTQLRSVSISGLPAGMTSKAVNPANLYEGYILSGKPTKPGTYAVKLTITTAAKTHTQELLMKVNHFRWDESVVGVNPALQYPAADVGGNYPMYDGGLVPGSTNVKIPIGLALPQGATVTVAGFPAGMRWDAKEQALVGSPTTPGYTTVTFTVRYNGQTYTSSTTVYVAPKPTLTVKTLTVSPRMTIDGTLEGWDIFEPSDSAVSSMGKVTGAGSYNANAKAKLSATAQKGYVFAGWWTVDSEGEYLPFTSSATVDYRATSMTVTMPEEKETTLYAMFVDSGYNTTLSATVNAFNAEGHEAGVALVNAETGLPISVEVGSFSLPTVTVTGLPSGVKFDAKTLVISGTPTTPGVYPLTITVKNSGGATKTFKGEDEPALTLKINNFRWDEEAVGISNLPDSYPADATDVSEGYTPGVEIAPIHFADWEQCTDTYCANWGEHVVLPDGATISVSGLPNGLKWDAAKKRISGKPTTYVKPTTVTFTLTTKDRKTHKATSTFYIAPLPTVKIKVMELITDDNGKTYVVSDDVGTARGEGAYAVGANVSLSATPKTGYVFSGWLVEEDSYRPINDVGHYRMKPGTSDYRTATQSYALEDPDAQYSYPNSMPRTGTFTMTLVATFVQKDADASIRSLAGSNNFGILEHGVELDAGVPLSYGMDEYGQLNPTPISLSVDSHSFPTVTVTGLPPGLRFEAKSLNILGTPTTPGIYPIKVVARNVSGATMTADGNAPPEWYENSNYFTIRILNQNEILTDVEGYEKDESIVITAGDEGYAFSPEITARLKGATCSGLPSGMTWDSANGVIKGWTKVVKAHTVTFTKNGKKTTMTFVVRERKLMASLNTEIPLAGNLVAYLKEKTQIERFSDLIKVWYEDDPDETPISADRLTITVKKLPTGLRLTYDTADKAYDLTGTVSNATNADAMSEGYYYYTLEVSIADKRLGGEIVLDGGYALELAVRETPLGAGTFYAYGYDADGLLAPAYEVVVKRPTGVAGTATVRWYGETRTLQFFGSESQYGEYTAVYKNGDLEVRLTPSPAGDIYTLTVTEDDIEVIDTMDVIQSVKLPTGDPLLKAQTVPFIFTDGQSGMMIWEGTATITCRADGTVSATLTLDDLPAFTCTGCVTEDYSGQYKVYTYGVPKVMGLPACIFEWIFATRYASGMGSVQFTGGLRYELMEPVTLEP